MHNDRNILLSKLADTLEASRADGYLGSALSGPDLVMLARQLLRIRPRHSLNVLSDAIIIPSASQQRFIATVLSCLNAHLELDVEGKDRVSVGIDFNTSQESLFELIKALQQRLMFPPTGGPHPKIENSAINSGQASSLTLQEAVRLEVRS